MTEARIDHVAEARNLLDIEWRDSNITIAQASKAQVHATLALVEQQRIANLIALRQYNSDVLREEEWEPVEKMIRDGVGL